MGNTTSAVSSPLGGVSPTFPIGTFVRVLEPTLTKQANEASARVSDKDSNESSDDEKEDEEKEGKGKPAEWTKEMNCLVGQIGIVMGGAPKNERDEATVGFRYKGPLGLKLSFQFSNKWLQTVAVENVPDAERRLLRKYMESELRKVVASLFAYTKVLHTNSFFGPCGALVRVRPLPTTDTKNWSDHHRTSIGQYGIVLFGVFKPLIANTTLVMFAEPVCWRYEYHDNDLEPVTAAEVNNASVLELRGIVMDVYQTHLREKAAEIATNQHEKVMAMLEKMTERLEAIEQRLLHLNSAPTDGPRLAIEGASKE